jgi:hypothetical protein
VFALEPESARARLCRGALELDRGRPSLALPWLDAYAVGPPKRSRGQAFEWPGGSSGSGGPADALIELDAVVGLQGRVTPDDYLVRAQVQREAGWSNERVLMGLDEGRARLGEPIGLELASIDLELELGTFDRALVRLDRIAPALRKEGSDPRTAGGDPHSGGAHGRSAWRVRRGTRGARLARPFAPWRPFLDAGEARA